MHTFKIGKREWSAASSFDELRPDEFKRFAGYKARKLTRIAFLQRCGFFFSRIPWKFYKNLTAAQRLDLEYRFDWMLSPIKMELWKMPQVRIGLKYYYGPGRKFRNVSGNEFAFADFYYNQYHATEKEEFLNLLMATLYRTSAWFPSVDDRRRKFDDVNIEKRAKKFAKLPFAVKYAVYLNYIGIRETLVKLHPLTFSGKKSEEKAGMDDIFDSLSGSEYGTFEQIGELSILTILNILEKREKKQLREARLKKKREQHA